jgi:cytochrome b561
MPSTTIEEGIVKTNAIHRAFQRSATHTSVYTPDDRRTLATESLPPSHLTRILHLLLLLAVLNQLITSQLIQRPLPGDAPSALFSLHEYVGLATFVIVFAFWLWTLLRRGETRFVRLFPWFSPRHMKALVVDTLGQLHRLSHGDPSDHDGGAMASAVHGLGLAVMTGMAVTGTLYFFMSGPLAHTALSLHSLMANLVWAYLISHSAMAALHHLLGSDILVRMFWLSRK